MSTSRRLGVVGRLVGAVAIVVLVAACGGGEADDPSGEATADDVAAWPFDEDPDESTDPPAEDDTPSGEEPSGGERAGEDLTGGSGVEAAETPIDETDPCSLVTLAEWASWRQVDSASAEQKPLEGGDACGYLTEDDTVRLALATVEMEGGSWLPDDVASEAVDVDGHRARWAIDYPVEVSSVLVVEVGDAELILEMSARDGTSDADLRAGAVDLAAKALGRLQS